MEEFVRDTEPEEKRQQDNKVRRELRDYENRERINRGVEQFKKDYNMP